MRNLKVTKLLALSAIALALLTSFAGVTKAMFMSEEHTSNPVEVSTSEPRHSSSVVLAGKVTAVDAMSLAVDGTAVALSAGTEIKGSPVVGSLVVVEANQQADGSLLAKEVKVVAVLPSVTPTDALTKTPEAMDDHLGQTRTPEVENEDHHQGVTQTPEIENEDHHQGVTTTPEVENEGHHQDVTKTPEVEKPDDHADVTKTPEPDKHK